MKVNVNVVAFRWNDDWILSRMALHLIKRNKWNPTKEPDRRADVNVFFPYLIWRFSHWRATPAAAFMTHYIPSDQMRKECWTHTAERVDLRVSMCEQYADILRQYGPTVNITPPVELDKFVIVDTPEHSRPVIGVSGEVYPGGRKGEHLVKKLQQMQGHRLKLVASGKGWPVRTKHYEWRDMQTYYQNLDVFLCTSTTEGGPVTVLEALACGKPVVVPSGVGLIDELPSEAGIWRYTKGDYKSMEQAIERALEDRQEPEALRALVEDHTIERYCDEWQEAVEGMLQPVPEYVEPKRTLPDWRTHGGVYIVAYGKRAHDCAYHLIKSLHKQMPDLPVCLACEGYVENFQKPANIDDKGYSSPISDVFKKLLREGKDIMLPLPMKDRRARSQKTKIYSHAPEEWEYVLYMDADMLVIDKLDAFFAPLQDGWDMVVTQGTPHTTPLVSQAQREKYKEENLYTDSILGTPKWLQVAGGIWSFRRNEYTKNFLEAFHAEWKRYQHTDQQAMMRAYWRHPVRMWTLPQQYNWFMHRMEPKPKDRAVVLHFATAARAWVEKHDGRKLWRTWREKV